jgi:alpha-amylase/alpha-mannosidase (GH57 family)
MPELQQPIRLVLLWHMHQPEYANPATGVPSLPWTRLHALKDYADMADRLARHPGARSTVNVSPCLIDQLRGFADGSVRPDPFLETARKPAAELRGAERRFLVTHFLEFRRDTLARDLPRVRELAALRGEYGSEEIPAHVVERFGDAELRDLQVLYHLAWCGNLLQADPVVRGLREKGSRFTEEDKNRLLDIQDRFLRGVLDRWIALAGEGHVEFSVSPYHHPVLPLLDDLDSALETLPSLRLPTRSYRHRIDARAQVDAAVRAFEETFGRRPVGGWPPEGAISGPALRLTGEAGLDWAASDEEVLLASLGIARIAVTARQRAHRARVLYRPWRLEGGPVILFRDRELSELVGSGYAAWGPRLAATDFLRRLEKIRADLPSNLPPPVVTVALDGENPWEAYPENGQPFLDALLEALEQSDTVHPVTASEAADSADPETLSHVAAGSWIGGNLAAWIGHPEKNRAWELLAETRQAVAGARGSDQPTFDDPAWRALMAAEGSDWFWWFGDDHPTPFAAEFDACFRAWLQAAWREAGLEPPELLDEPIRKRERQPWRTPVGPVQPVLDGRVTDYFEWLSAARVPAAAGELPSTRRVVGELFFGSDGTDLFLRLDPADAPASASLGGSVLRLIFPGFPDRTVTVALPGAGPSERGGTRMAVERVAEIAVRLDEMPAEVTGYRFLVEIEGGGGEVQRIPEEGSLLLPSEEERRKNLDWFV